MYRTLKKTINNGLCYDQSKTIYIQINESLHLWSYHVTLVSDVDTCDSSDYGESDKIPSSRASSWWYEKIKLAVQDVVEQELGMGCNEDDVSEWTKELSVNDFKGDKWEEHWN